MRLPEAAYLLLNVRRLLIRVISPARRVGPDTHGSCIWEAGLIESAYASLLTAKVLQIWHAT